MNSQLSSQLSDVTARYFCTKSMEKLRFDNSKKVCRLIGENNPRKIVLQIYLKKEFCFFLIQIVSWEKNYT